MLKFVVVACRRPDLSAREFQDYFRQVHGPLAERLPGLRRYVRNYPAPDQTRNPPPWDCIVELYFDDWESMEAAWRSPEGKQSDADLQAFCDLPRTTWSVVEEEVIR
jgi:uncharacterized protein (TIGR02118 family)